MPYRDTFGVTGDRNFRSKKVEEIKPEEMVIKLESILADLSEAHTKLAKTNLPGESYNPISKLMATAKVDLFNILQSVKSKTP